MKNSFYTQEELKTLGIKAYGKDILISRNAQFYNADKIILGNHIRIDDFCILSGKITIKNYVHLAAYTGIFAGNAGVTLNDYVGVSSRSAIYAVTDDYLGNAMTNPTVPEEYRNLFAKAVVFEEHSLIGTGCTVLPGVTLHTGASVGAMSLVNKDLDEWAVYVGIPCKKVKERNRVPLKMAKELSIEE